MLIMTMPFKSFAFLKECTQNEAQFFGNVINHEKHRIDQQQFECTYEISLTQFQPSGVCPLQDADVYNVKFSDESCSLKNGQELSGILVQSIKDGVISIE